MSTLEQILSNDGLTWVLFEFLGYHGCLALAMTNKRTEVLIFNQHFMFWRQYVLKRVGFDSSFAGDLPQDAFNWRSAASLVSVARQGKEELWPGEKVKKGIAKHFLTLLDNLIINAPSEPMVECSGKIDTDEPHLFLPSLDLEMKLPLDPSQLRQLIDGGHCEQAPFGRGSDTVIDLDYRKCWRLDLGGSIHIINTDFIPSSSSQPGTILHEIKDKMLPTLGLRGEIFAQPYQMLIYEEGGMFLPHKDTLRGSNNFGSLVVTLPVRGGCVGGDLVLSHESITNQGGEEKVIVNKVPSESEGPKWVAFFTDIMHEVRPVKSGYRVSLTYHLWVSYSLGQITRPVKRSKSTLEHDLSKLQNLFGHIVDKWYELNDVKKYRLILALDHQYSIHSRSNLRGRDNMIFEIIKKSVESTALTFSAEDVHTCAPDVPGVFNYDGDVTDRQTTFKIIDVEKNGRPKNNKRVIWLNHDRFAALKKRTAIYQQNTGNEGYQNENVYEAVCLVLMHSSYDSDSDFDSDYYN